MKKIALITGASSGLGLEFAKIYAKNGYNLVIVARSEGKLYQLKAELENAYNIEVIVFAKDLSERDAGHEVFDYCLENNIEVDVLVNNAGVGDFANFIESDWERQYDMVQVNIVALMQLTRCFAPQMVKRESGKILNLSSIAAFCAGPKMSVYYASKEYVRSFSEALSEELKGTGVTVTALCPGPTSTGFEQAAEMKNSKMFTFFKPATAKEVAEAGFIACEKGKTLKYYGMPTKLMNIGARLAPRSVGRKFAMKING